MRSDLCGGKFYIITQKHIFDLLFFGFFFFEAVHKKIEGQIEDVCLVQSKEVPLFWYGMAEVRIENSLFV